MNKSELPLYLMPPAAVICGLILMAQGATAPGFAALAGGLFLVGFEIGFAMKGGE